MSTIQTSVLATANTDNAAATVDACAQAVAVSLTQGFIHIQPAGQYTFRKDKNLWTHYMEKQPTE